MLQSWLHFSKEVILKIDEIKEKELNKFALFKLHRNNMTPEASSEAHKLSQDIETLREEKDRLIREDLQEKNKVRNKES